MVFPVRAQALECVSQVLQVLQSLRHPLTCCILTHTLISLSRTLTHSHTTQPFTNSPTHSLTRTLPHHSLTLPHHSFTHTLMHSLPQPRSRITQSLTQSLTHTLLHHSLILLHHSLHHTPHHSLTHALTHSLIRSLTHPPACQPSHPSSKTSFK